MAAIELTPDELDLDVGDTLRLQALAFDEDGRPLVHRPIQWTVGNSSLIEVSTTGLVRGKAEGTTFVRATSGAVHAVAQVMIQDPASAPPSLTQLQPPSTTAGGAGFQLVVRGSGFSPNSSILWGGDGLHTVWIDEGELRAQVSPDAVADAGTVEVRVTRNAATSEPMIFTVLPAGGAGAPAISRLTPSSIAAGSASFELRVQGRGFTRDALVLWNGEPRLTQWVAESEVRVQVAVDDVWLPGQVSVRVSNGGAEPSGLDVTDPAPFAIDPSGVATLTVSPTPVTLVPGGSQVLSVRLLDAGGSELTGRALRFLSTNPSVVAVDADGTLDAVGTGTASVLVTTSDRQTQVEVTVTPRPISRVSISPPTALVAAGTHFQLVARAYGADGREVVDPDLYWSSDDPSIATVDDEGLLTARARGTTRIWVQASETKAHAAIEVFEVPNGTLWTYDLRWDDSTIPPAVGDTTWVDDRGVRHAARFVLASASFGVERYEQRWEQVMAWEVWEGSERLGTVLRSQGGTIGYDFGTGDLAFYSLEEPTEVLATGRYNNNFGELWLRQVIGTAVQSTYRYVIR